MKLTLGAYPSYPDTPKERGRLIVLLAEDPLIGSLELPVPFPGKPCEWPAGAASGWAAVVTDIPATMTSLDKDCRFGLASPEENGRQAAIEAVQWTRKQVRSLVASGIAVPAVELHSAPRGTADASALGRSLAEITGWDWGGAQLVIEHCDSWREGPRTQKGFLALRDEIRVAGDAGLGICINWGRSVIETGTTDGPLEHIGAVAAAGIPLGLMFSSVSDRATTFGPPWCDAHLPPRGVTGAPVESLLDEAAILAALRELPAEPLFIGAKIAVQPSDAPVETRAACLRETLALVAHHQGQYL